MSAYSQSFAHPGPPPDPPELPEGVDPRPRWPVWYAPVGFLVGFAATVLVFILVLVPLEAAGVELDESSPEFTAMGALIQAVALVGTAVMFASWTRRPRAWHFGLRPARFWPAVGWSALGMLCFYAFAVAYSVALEPDAEQTVVEDLGADESTALLILAGFVVICVAPIAEEFFFRGFFYRALRSRLAVIPAALIDGALFGLIHFTGADTLEILPILGVLGFVFCLVYERTGTLYAPIALHAFNNMIAYAASLEDEPLSVSVSLALGFAMIAMCTLLPRLTGRKAPALP